MVATVGEKISVCLLSYNHIHLIESTIRSLLDQSVDGHEIIVSDDCSTDGTWEHVVAMAREDRRIRPIRTPRNLGMPGNANFAISQCSRPYIALLHHDDLCRQDLLTRWSAVLERNPDIAFVFCAYSHFDSPRVNCEELEERTVGRLFLEKHLFARWDCPVHGTAMIRRSAWERAGGMREEFNLLADIDLWMRLSAKSAVGYVAEPLIAIRHDRPTYYPDMYTRWSWRRHRYLYEIHAHNRRDLYSAGAMNVTLNWWSFRIRVTLETAKWLAYGVVRRRKDIIFTSEEGLTPYHLWPVRIFRRAAVFWAMRRWGQQREQDRSAI